MGEQVFPQVERVIYRNTVLVEVICQVRFPVDLRIETEPPADFQQRVRSQFPLLVQKSRAMLSALPPDVAKALESVVPQSSNSTVWRFSTEDSAHIVELSKDSLTMVAHKYGRWEEFLGFFSAPLAAFLDLYKPPFFTRIGLRYQDIIERSKLKLDGIKWSALLKPEVLGELREAGIEGQAVEAFRNLLLTLPERNAKVRLQHGFAEIEGSKEQAYLIDCDFFVERTEIGDANQILEYFHGNAASYFRWCITEKLHSAMDPQPIAT